MHALIRPRPVGASLSIALALAQAGCGGAGPGGDTRASAQGPTKAAGDPAAATPAPPPLAAAELAALPGRIVYLAESAGEAAIAELRFGPEGPVSKDLSRRPSIGEGPSIFPGALAPDGALIAVITVDEGPAGHSERLELRPLLPGSLGPPIWQSEAAAQVRSPVFAPDGAFVVFESSVASFRDLYRVDLGGDGGTIELRRLTDHPAGNYEPAISPDAAQIAFVSSRDQNAEIYVMAADGAGPRRITRAPLDDWGPIWAPDGRTLAFLSNRDGVDRIYLCGADGDDLRPLVAGDAKAAAHPTGAIGFEASEAEPAWSPDGAAVIFSVRTGPRRAAIRLATIGDGAVIDVTPGDASDRSPVWAPDGRFVVFSSDRGGDLELHVSRRDGGAVTRLTARPGADWLPRWSAR